MSPYSMALIPKKFCAGHSERPKRWPPELGYLSARCCFRHIAVKMSWLLEELPSGSNTARLSDVLPSGAKQLEDDTYHY